MTETEILSKIQTVFAEILDDENIAITKESNPETVEGWDSFALVQIILSLEKSFGIKFKSEEIFEWKNVGDIVNSVSKKVE